MGGTMSNELAGRPLFEQLEPRLMLSEDEVVWAQVTRLVGLRRRRHR